MSHILEYLEKREKDWGKLPDNQNVQVLVAELKVLLGHFRDKIDLMNSERDFTNDPLKHMPKLSQRQDSTKDQLRDLIMIANKLGMYDAADYISKTVFKDNI